MDGCLTREVFLPESYFSIDNFCERLLAMSRTRSRMGLQRADFPRALVDLPGEARKSSRAALVQ
jgi:hypothetical protein